MRAPQSLASDVAQGVVDALAKEGIGARRGVGNAHEQPAYADPASHRVVGTLEESERAAREGLCLPLVSRPSPTPTSRRVATARLSAILSTMKPR